MNVLLERLESFIIGDSIDVGNTPLLDFGNGHVLTQKDASVGILAMAGIGKGKSTLLKTICRAMLRERFGGLVLSVKASQIAEFIELCKLEGRERDLIILGKTKHCFNPLEGELNASEAAALVCELAEVLSNRVSDGGESDSFWRSQITIILKNLFTLCLIANGKMDILDAANLFASRANSLAEIGDPIWNTQSPMASAIRLAKSLPHDPNARLAVQYFTHDFPTHGDRLQGSLAATVASVFDYFCRPPLCHMFSGESTFSFEDIFERGKICVVGLPLLDSEDGRIANALMQFCMCRSAPKKTRKDYTLFLSDECQETVSRELMRKLAVLREYKVCVVLATQNISVLDAKIGEIAREGLLALVSTKIFGTQNHAATCQWMAEQIGKQRTEITSQTKGNSSGKGGGGSSNSHTVQTQWDYRVPPSRFARLSIGETICLRDGAMWSATWHKNMPGRNGSVKIVD